MQIQGARGIFLLRYCPKKLTPIKQHRTRGFLTTCVQQSSSVTWKNAKPFSEIPSLFMLPYFGTAWQNWPIVGRYDNDRQLEATHEKRMKLGNIVREKFGSFEAVLCCSVEDLKEVLKNEGKYPSRPEFATLKTYRELRKEYYSTTGLLVVQGEEWHDLRTKTQKHLLRPASIQQYLSPMQDVAREMVQRIVQVRDVNKEVPNFLFELYKWALESVTMVGLDTRLGCLKKDESPESDGMRMLQCVLTQFECMNKLEAFTGNLPYWKLFPTPTWKKFVKASDIYTEIAFKYINRSLEDMKIKVEKEDSHLTLLQAMLAKKDLDVKDAIVFVADMLMAGVETTSHSACWLLYHLAKNPEKQEILYQEITKILPIKEAKITPKTYEELQYLKSCMKESLRLNPVVSNSARVINQDTVLSGYQVPAGTFIIVSFEEIFLDEKNFKNPTKFQPERWLNKDEKIDPFAHVPFGFGARSCIGKRLAELEMISLVTEIVRNFKVEYHYEDIGVITKVVNIPDKPLKFNFIER